MKKEYKRIHKVSKKLLSKDHRKKLKKVKDISERTEGLKYLVASNLQLRLLDLESKIRRAEKGDSGTLETKMILLPLKIGIFKTTHSKKDYNVVMRLIKEIEEELKHVRIFKEKERR